MAIGTVNVGKHRIIMAAYNPRDALSMLACSFTIHKCKAAMQDVTEQEFCDWVRQHVPQGGELLDLIDQGWHLAQTRGLPVTPGEERYQLPIIGWLLREQEAQRATTDP